MTTSCAAEMPYKFYTQTDRSLIWQKLALRLEHVGKVSFNSFLLRLKIDIYELTVFPDGRLIITGTNDAAVAKGLYAKYIGM